MRRLLAVLVAAGMSLGGVAVAHAGTLTSATLQITLSSHVFNVQAAGATGNSTATSATLDAGFAFATTQTFPVLLPATAGSLVLQHNGALTATSGGAVNVTSGATGRLKFYANNKSLTVVQVPIDVGFDTTSSYYIPTPITPIYSRWRVDQAQVASSGITRVSYPNAAGTGVSTAAQTHLTATGSFHLTPGGAGTVTLVSIAHVIVSGASPSNTVSPSFLTLTYAAPEPGTLLLLGAGAAGLALAGGRKKKSVRSAG